MKEIRLAYNILRTGVKDRIQYPDRLLVDTVGIAARCGVLLVLYSYVFKLGGGVINGTTFAITAWSILFYFIASLLRIRDIPKVVMQDVQSGNVEVLFSKPISYLAYRMWWQVGSGLYSFFVVGAAAILVLWLIVGVPDTMTLPIFLPTLLLTFLVGCVLELILYSIVGLLAFWIEDIHPIFWIIDKTVMILGGSYLPLALFPVFMYKFSLYSPFGAVKFITHTISPSWQSEWPLLVGIQFGWIVLLGILIFWLFKKVQQKVSVNGG